MDSSSILVYKCLNNLVPQYLYDYFSRNYSFYSYNTRRREDIQPSRSKLRAQLYGLGYPRQPSPRATLAEVTFSLFLSKIQPAVYIRIANSSRGRDNSGGRVVSPRQVG